MEQNSVRHRHSMAFLGHYVTESRAEIDYGNSYVSYEMQDELQRAGLDIDAYLELNLYFYARN